MICRSKNAVKPHKLRRYDVTQPGSPAVPCTA